MSGVIVAPGLMEAAAKDLSAIGSTLSAAHTAAAASTTTVLPAATDEVSAGIAHVFSGYARDYQKLAGQGAAFHEDFVQRLTAGAFAYARAEAANTAFLQPLTAIIDSIGSGVGRFWDELPQTFNSLILNIRDVVTNLLMFLSNPGLYTVMLVGGMFLIGILLVVILFAPELLLLVQPF